MADLDEIRNRFAFHPARDDKTRDAHEAVRQVCGEIALIFAELLPDCRETSLAITKLEETMFWANAGIARKFSAIETAES